MVAEVRATGPDVRLSVLAAVANGDRTLVCVAAVPIAETGGVPAGDASEVLRVVGSLVAERWSVASGGKLVGSGACRLKTEHTCVP